MKISYGFMTGAAFCLAIAGPVMAQSTAHGAALFSAECSACHSATPGENGVGPSLAGIYGMRAAMVPGYKYSLALRQSHIVWTTDALESFLANPAVDVAGTAMPHPGTEMHMAMPSAIDRGDIIAYLRTLRQ